MTEAACHICTEPMDENRASCNDCGRDFHLALRTDRPARDCGDAWIDDEMQALLFGCNACLGRAAETSVPRKRIRRTGMRASAVARARKRPHGR